MCNVISCFITTSNCRAHPESQVGTRLKLTGQKKIINIPWNLHCNYKLLYLPLRSLDLSDFFLSLSLSFLFPVKVYLFLPLSNRVGLAFILLIVGGFISLCKENMFMIVLCYAGRSLFSWLIDQISIGESFRQNSDLQLVVFLVFSK